MTLRAKLAVAVVTLSVALTTGAVQYKGWSAGKGAALAQAVGLFNQGKYDDSFRAFQSLTARSPKNTSAKFWLARHYMEGRGTPKDLDKAINIFTRLGTGGMSSAYVWAAVALERRRGDSDVSQAMTFYEKSLHGGTYASSLKRLSQAYQSGTGVTTNKVKSIRYLARFHLMGRAADPSSYGCFDLMKALQEETAVAREKSQPDKLLPLTGGSIKLTDCIRETGGKNWKQLIFVQVANYAKTGLVRGGSHVPQVSKGKVASGAAGFKADVLPPGFAMTYSIASDSDSQTYPRAIANQTTIQQNLGLPISASTFMIGNGRNSISAFFAGRRNSGSQPFGQSATQMTNHLRLWHKGWLDHIHGWSDYRVLATHRFSRSKPLNSGIEINLSSLFDKKNSQHAQPNMTRLHADNLVYWTDQRYGVLRLYFDKRPPHDTVYAVNMPPYAHRYDVNANKLFTRAVKENNRSVFLVELPIGRVNASEFHKVIPLQSATAPVAGGLIRSSVDNHVSINAPSCKNSKCQAKLLTIEMDPVSTKGMAAHTEWLKYFNVRPIINTAHGGERVGSFATDRYFQKHSTEAGKITNVSQIWMGLASAGQQGDKAYAQGIFEDLGIRAVRPFRSKFGNVMTVLGQPAFINTEFGAMATLITTWTGITAARYNSRAEFVKLAKARMNLTDETIATVWEVGQCGFQRGGWLPGIVEASQRRKLPKQKSGDIWYTHFGAYCIDPTRVKGQLGFTKASVNALSRLSRRHYGLGESLESIGFQRLWVLPPSAAVRHRMLDAELSSQNLKIEALPNHFKIQPTLGLFIPESFPRPGLEERDLNGLTLRIEDREKLSAATVAVGTKQLIWLVKQAPKGSKSGYVTILDTTAAYPVLDEIPWSASSGPGIKVVKQEAGAQGSGLSFEVKSGTAAHCFRPDLPGTLDNVSAVGLSLSEAGPDDSIAIEFKTARHTGSVVVTNRFERLKPGLKYQGNTMLDFDLAHFTQDGPWRNYLVPTYQAKTSLAKPIVSMTDVPLLQGRLEEVCIHYQSEAATTLKIDHLKLYRYVTANRLPTDPLIVAGVVKGASGSKAAGSKAIGDRSTSASARFVKITGQSGKPKYASIGANGFYLAHVNDGPQVVSVELMGASKGKRDLQVLQKRKVHLVKSEAHVDFDLGVGQ